ncbi:spore coat protein CotJB [Paenibacillus sp. LMG 31461]|uniref:Spore coat protein CotJB n=1 Tax=Paenibacillus plantarum TaxID=2654975 RepID=A0ABX1XNQ6_9BACL|nr:spore coat protein CotJB [Paenibacillus plantarum]NOU69500.1 spore coat protein CotJB [Paenibacillus plantarum]
MSERALPEAYYTQLRDLQAVDFVLVELTLYLDTHPDDLSVLQQYNQFAHKRMHMAQQFEMEFGPLMPFGHSFTKAPWQWVETPWPWQV